MQQLTRPDGSPVRVLVVDDEINIAELLADLLEERGVLVQDEDTADRSDSRSVRGVLPTVATPP